MFRRLRRRNLASNGHWFSVTMGNPLNRTSIPVAWVAWSWLLDMIQEELDSCVKVINWAGEWFWQPDTSTNKETCIVRLHSDPKAMPPLRIVSLPLRSYAKKVLRILFCHYPQDSIQDNICPGQYCSILYLPRFPEQTPPRALLKSYPIIVENSRSQNLSLLWTMPPSTTREHQTNVLTGRGQASISVMFLSSYFKPYDVSLPLHISAFWYSPLPLPFYYSPPSTLHSQFNPIQLVDFIKMGVEIKVLSPGNGTDFPKAGSDIVMNYTGCLYDDSVGESNHFMGQEYVLFWLPSHTLSFDIYYPQFLLYFNWSIVLYNGFDLTTFCHSGSTLPANQTVAPSKQLLE